MKANVEVGNRKLKRTKNFKPYPTDEGNELFPNGIFEFNVTKLLAFIRENPNQFPVESVEVEPWISSTPERLNEKTIQAADLSVPIILAEISPGRFNVIDGNHRIERARRSGMKRIAAHRVFAECQWGFLTSVKAYEAYIKYWNDKVDDALLFSETPLTTHL